MKYDLRKLLNEKVAVVCENRVQELEFYKMCNKINPRIDAYQESERMLDNVEKICIYLEDHFGVWKKNYMRALEFDFFNDSLRIQNNSCKFIFFKDLYVSNIKIETFWDESL
jgi:hypothetical protein